MLPSTDPPPQSLPAPPPSLPVPPPSLPAPLPSLPALPVAPPPAAHSRGAAVGPGGGGSGGEEGSERAGLLMGALETEPSSMASGGMAPDRPYRRGLRVLRGHPPGLAVLFCTEAFERFSYYGMRALLVLYMTHIVLPKPTNILGMRLIAPLVGVPGDDVSGAERERMIKAAASRLYGFYTALVYLTPLVGGYLADNYFGQRPMVLLGALTMAAGHVLMAWREGFLIALILIIAGNGAFKPCLTAQLSRLYVDAGVKKENAPEAFRRRAHAYSIFYIGINVGAFLSPLVCGALRARFGANEDDPTGYHAGFFAAGAGMVVSTLVYVGGARLVPPDERRTAFSRRARTRARRYDPIDGSERVRAPSVEDGGQAPARTGGAGGGVGATLSRYRLRTAAYCLMVLFVVPLASVMEQGGNTTSLFAEEGVDRTFFGAEVPTEWVQAINPFCVVAFTPLVQGTYSRLDARGREPHTIRKMAFGAATLFLSQVIIAAGSATTRVTCTDDSCVFERKANMMWLVASIATLTLGELQINPGARDALEARRTHAAARVSCSSTDTLMFAWRARSRTPALARAAHSGAGFYGRDVAGRPGDALHGLLDEQQFRWKPDGGSARRTVRVWPHQVLRDPRGRCCCHLRHHVPRERASAKGARGTTALVVSAARGPADVSMYLYTQGITRARDASVRARSFSR